MRLYRIVVAAGFVLATGACVKAGTAIADAGQIAICVDNAVLAQVAAGLTTFEEIAAAIGTKCGALSAAEVEQIIAVLEGSSSPTITDELRTKLKAVHHKAIS